MTTKLQPSNIDASLNYSVNQLAANTVLDNGVRVITVANSAFNKANTAQTDSIAFSFLTAGM